MKKMRSKSLFMFFIFLFISCGMNQDDYLAYLQKPENGLIQKKETNKAIYKLLYKPIDLMIERESRYSNQSKKEIRDALGALDYYLLEINRNSSQNKEKENFYYAYSFEKDIFYLRNHDTIRPILYQLDQGIGGSSHLRINLAFAQVDSDIRISIRDKYGSNLDFVFKEDDINNIPKLNI